MNNKKPPFQHIFSNFNKESSKVDEIINKNISDKSTNKTKNNKNYLTKNEVKNLASLLSIYRSKKYETFRYILLDKENNIVDHLAISNQLPDKSSAFLKNKEATFKKLDEADFFYSVLNHIKKNNLNVVIVHNHPSGDVTPSNEDNLLTSRIELRINQLGGKNKFFGHIILDHGKVNYYTPEGKWKIKNSKKDELHFEAADWNSNTYDNNENWKNIHLEKSLHDPLLKKQHKIYQDVQIDQMSKISKLASIAENLDAKENWNLNKFTPVFCLNNKLTVVGIKFFDNQDILRKSKTTRGIKSIKNNLEKTAKNYSIHGFIPFISKQDLLPSFEKIAKQKAFIDMCIKSSSQNNSWTSWLQTKNIESHMFDLKKESSVMIPTFEASSNFKNSIAGKKIKKKCSFYER